LLSISITRMRFAGHHTDILKVIAATAQLKTPWMQEEKTVMDRIIYLPKLLRLPDPGPRGRSTDTPSRHFLMFAVLLLILFMGAVLHTLSAQFIGLIAFLSLIFCHFVDTMCYQKSDRRLAAIFGASPNPIVVYNNQGHPQRLNPAFTQIFGWTLEELRGRCIPFVPEAETSITGQKIAEIFQTGRPVTFETRRMTKAGDIRDVIISAAIALDRGNTPWEMVVTITDITERKHVEAQLQQAQKMEAIGTLAGGIAHDFNNLLSPLIGYGEMLMDDLPADSPMQEKAAEILTAGRRAKELVNQILTFSRQSDAKPEAIKLQPFITETLKLIRASIPSNIHIRKQIDADCGPVMANPTQIHQVVMNLATNAYHAMEGTGGELSVTLRQVFMKEDLARSEGLPPGRYAHLIVADTGIGIEKQNVAKIFDPYFTTKGNNQGTGLGLSVVQGIINSVGGNIRVLSEKSRGSEFHVYWPLTRYEKQTATTRSPAPVPGGTENILLVDDEASVMKMVRQMLERLGYQVAAFTSGVEALAAFKDNPGGFDLVLTDMTMPEMTGDLLATEVMGIRPAIPVLISTGYSATLTAEVAMEVGIKGVIRKPASKSDLAVAIRKALEKNRRSDSASHAAYLPESA
jgi:two-component system, cell cycle sensor histidine kinase and response regulator CckA